MSIHPATSLGKVHYTVADLDKQIDFYREILGLHLLWREDRTAALGTAERELLRLTEEPGARRVRGVTGLYHTAFLLPTRIDLAHLLRRIALTRTPIQGTSDHGTHLAIYLPDAEGNGIELAWDFPRSEWPMRDGKFDLEAMPRRGIDFESLLSELEEDGSEWAGLPPGATVGHVHLHVSDLGPTRTFYHEILGFDITMDNDAFGGLFFSAGGYHHHIGTNIWLGRGAPPPPEGATGLRYYTVAFPDKDELDRAVARLAEAGFTPAETGDGIMVNDPSRIGVLLQAG